MGERPRGLIDLGSPTLLDALGLHPGARLEAGGPWVLEHLFPFHEGGVLLSFRRDEARETFGLQLRRRDDGRPAWRRTRHLDVITQIRDRAREASILAALGPLVDRLDAADGPATEVVDAPAAGDPPPPARRLMLPAAHRPEAPSPFDFGRVFVLDLATDCGQRCSFCSTRRKMSPASPTPGAELPRLRSGLEHARAAGCDVLRLSGLDPLAHPDIVAVAVAATTLGFRHVHVYSPAVRLADRTFRRALLDALPRGSTFHVPVYGADAATHDEVTGVPGSFAACTEALDGLVADAGLDRLLLLTVVTRSNLAGLPALRRCLARWPAPVQVFLPFPSTRAPDDAFFEVAAAHSEMVPFMAACEPPLGLSELLPCVRLRHELETGRPTLSQGGFPPVTAPLGTLFEHGDYRRLDDEAGNTFTIPVRRCPVAADCALAAVCPRSVYSAYADRFGLSELVAVTPDQVLAVAPDLAAMAALTAADS